MEQKSKQFHIGDILSITTDMLVSPRLMKGVYDILNYMTGDNLMTHQLPRVAKECKPYLIEQYPQLNSPEMSFALADFSAIMAKTSDDQKGFAVLGWLSKIYFGDYGIKFPSANNMLDVKPLPKGCHQYKNPIEEVVEMVGKNKVIVVEV